MMSDDVYDIYVLSISILYFRFRFIHIDTKRSPSG